MTEIIENVIKNVLGSLYQLSGFSILTAILFMFLYMQIREHGWRILAKKWIEMFKTQATFRYVFCLTFYTVMILFKTLMNRKIWGNPISNVIGVWGIYDVNGQISTEVIENLALFIPFSILLLCSFHRQIVGKSVRLFRIIIRITKIVFLFSVIIESLQLFLHLGTFQLSDLFYNTLGGCVGGLMYWIGKKIIRRNDQEEQSNV